MDNITIKRNLGFYKYNRTMSMGYSTSGLKEDAQKAFQLLYDLSKAGITTEQLEKLARGEAWVAEWLQADSGLEHKWEYEAILSQNGVFLIDTYFDARKGDNFLMLFNGSSEIPTPKEKNDES